MTKNLTIKLDPENRLIIEILKGEITLKDLVECQSKMINNPEFSDSYYTLLDIRGAVFNFTKFDKIRFSVFLRDIATNFNLDRKCAIVTNSPEEVVSSIIFQKVMRAVSPLKIKIFSTIEAALEYLKY
jgi:hypothetical protein